MHCIHNQGADVRCCTHMHRCVAPIATLVDCRKQLGEPGGCCLNLAQLVLADAPGLGLLCGQRYIAAPRQFARPVSVAYDTLRLEYVSTYTHSVDNMLWHE